MRGHTSQEEQATPVFHVTDPGVLGPYGDAVAGINVHDVVVGTQGGYAAVFDHGQVTRCPRSAATAAAPRRSTTRAWWPGRPRTPPGRCWASPGTRARLDDHDTAVGEYTLHDYIIHAIRWKDGVTQDNTVAVIRDASDGLHELLPG